MLGDRNKLVYVSGPYTAPTDNEINENIQRAEDIAVMLMRNGFDVITPHKNTAGYQQYEFTHERYLEQDINILSRCDAIIMMNGWRYSKGACIEMEYAREKKIPIILADILNSVKNEDIFKYVNLMMGE
jgi:nucleoside 2-deoxyribosyltransferase